MRIRARDLAATVWGRLGGAGLRIFSAYRPSDMFFGLGLLFTLVFVVSSIVADYHGLNALASISYVALDGQCPAGQLDTSAVGFHCFGDYYQVVGFSLNPDPWAVGSNYPPSGMIAQLFFGLIGQAFGSPRVGLICYLTVMGVALASPMIWATRGRSFAVRLIAISAFGFLSVPAVGAVDRGNGVALVVPAILVFLVSAVRGRFPLAITAVVLASMVKPQFALVALVFVAMGRWLSASIAVGGIVAANVAAYLFWPIGLPGTITESVVNILRYGGGVPMTADYPVRPSFGRAIYVFDEVVRSFFGLPANEWFAKSAGLIGTAVGLGVILVLVLAGRSIPVLMASSLILACASMFPGTTYGYYLVFALPIAAVILRDPLLPVSTTNWTGSLDRIPRRGWKGVGAFLFVVSTSMTVTRVLLPGTNAVQLPGSARYFDFVITSGEAVPLLWLATSVVVIIAWCLPNRARPAVEGSVPAGLPAELRSGNTQPIG